MLFEWGKCGGQASALRQRKTKFFGIRLSSASTLPPAAGSSKWLIRTVLLAATGLYFAGLSAIRMQPGNEAMCAFPAAEMIRTGEYLVPKYERGHFLEKPPLAWWALAASYKLFGVSLSSARLPGAIAAVLTAPVLGVWVRRRSGDLAGAIAAMVLLFTFEFGAFARTSPADTFLPSSLPSASLLSTGAPEMKAQTICCAA